MNVKTKQQEADNVCVHLNARSVRNKTFTIKEHILDHNADFLFLTETWLKPTDTAVIKELTPPGFNYFGADRLNKRAGGLAILVK